MMFRKHPPHTLKWTLNLFRMNFVVVKSMLGQMVIAERWIHISSCKLRNVIYSYTVAYCVFGVTMIHVCMYMKEAYYI